MCEMMSGKVRGCHVVVGGFEYDRVIAPVMDRYPVKKMIILKGDTSDSHPGADDLAQHFMDKLSDYPIDVETVDTDIYDFDEVFLKTLEVIEENADEDTPIYLNISSAPKLALVGMISAAFISDHRDQVEIFYGVPKKYLLPDLLERIKDMDVDDKRSMKELEEAKDEFLERGSGRGIRDYEEIPIFPIEDIESVDHDILSILKKNNGADSIKDLQESLNEEREEKIERSSLQYRLDKLKDLGLIKTERDNRRLKIGLTRLGDVYEKGN